MTFLERVLARTSGPACAAAEDRFASYVDGELDAVDRELVAGHVAGCRPCREELAQMRATAARPRWADTWRRLMLRPRFALEMAYIGAVVLCVIGTFTDFHVTEVRGTVKSIISELKEKP
ncbi:MAG TPA: zf-HC2 domain-containing protein [Candidatus Polarisedimenticolaceae bacterium]|nr:zf-HC2 domain-containing protein [Candidatus Polarisedimenticolaceae bacterium]